MDLIIHDENDELFQLMKMTTNVHDESLPATDSTPFVVYLDIIKNFTKISSKCAVGWNIDDRRRRDVWNHSDDDRGVNHGAIKAHPESRRPVQGHRLSDQLGTC